jgi:hypothetical protein
MGETRNTQYRSADYEDIRGDAAEAALGCPFDSKNNGTAPQATRKKCQRYIR